MDITDTTRSSDQNAIYKLCTSKRSKEARYKSTVSMPKFNFHKSPSPKKEEPEREIQEDNKPKGMHFKDVVKSLISSRNAQNDDVDRIANLKNILNAQPERTSLPALQENQTNHEAATLPNRTLRKRAGGLLNRNSLLVGFEEKKAEYEEMAREAREMFNKHMHKPLMEKLREIITLAARRKEFSQITSAFLLAAIIEYYFKDFSIATEYLINLVFFNLVIKTKEEFSKLSQ